AEERRIIPQRSAIHSPGRRHEIVMETLHNYDVTLDPHADVDGNRRNEEKWHTASHSLKPEQLWHDYIAGDKNPIHISVTAQHSINLHVRLELIAAIPRKESFRQIAVSHDQRRGEQEFSQIVQMAHS